VQALLPILLIAQTVSIEQLAHNIPEAAAREYRASTHALLKGNVEASIAHCEKALKTDPKNASAHNDLGVLYLNDSRAEEALVEFSRALELDQKMAFVHINKGFALLILGRAHEAEGEARNALKDQRSHLLLGWSLIAQYQYSDEALASLKFAESHLASADVLMHQGRFAEARKEVQIYLSSPDADQKSVAENWLQLLRQ
jgi:tetratricopeptide (TPR) repeat protein